MLNVHPIKINPTIGVGSSNPVKIAAVTAGARRIWPQVLVQGLAVDSGVAPQPLNDDEAIQGAENRARIALMRIPADFGVGIEGNTTDTPFGMFTTAWVVVVDTLGRLGLGSSGRLLLPSAIAQAIRQGGELGPLMDQFTGQSNTKQNQGAVGILTNGLIDRQQALETAVIFAFCRFVNPHYG